MPKRRAVLMIRQAISPRFAIRIFLNMLLYLRTLGGFLPASFPYAGADVTIPSTAKPGGGNGRDTQIGGSLEILRRTLARLWAPRARGRRHGLELEQFVELLAGQK